MTDDERIIDAYERMADAQERMATAQERQADAEQRLVALVEQIGEGVPNALRRLLGVRQR